MDHPPDVEIRPPPCCSSSPLASRTERDRSTLPEGRHVRYPGGGEGSSPEWSRERFIE